MLQHLQALLKGLLDLQALLQDPYHVCGFAEDQKQEELHAG
jgi:hypothetical protein